MDAALGYQTAKRLLKEHFGNDYMVAVAYINKALNWPIIKPDDGEALKAFALFLASCENVMAVMEFMEEMNNVANIKTVIYKLP